MSLKDRFKFNFWHPLRCKLGGHRIVCYKVIHDWPEDDSYMWWCHRCMDMRDYAFPCGGCDNACGRGRKDMEGSGA